MPEPTTEPTTEPPSEPTSAPAERGQSRVTLLAIVGAVIVVGVIALLLTTRSPGKDDTTAIAAAVATTVAANRNSGSLGTELSPTSVALGTDPTSEPVIVTNPPDRTTAPPNTHPLPPAPYHVAEATLQGAVPIYEKPGAAEPMKTLPNPIYYQGDRNAAIPLVMLVRQEAGPDWLEVFLPVRPNGSTGFVRKADVKVTSHRYRIEVGLGAYSLKAFDGDKVILDTKIAVAADNTPTPGGLYYTNMLLKPPNPNTAYGTYAYGLSGYSNAFEAFNGGPGQLGIHGTNEPAKIGQKVSHGCIRLKNEDIEQLVGILPLGVPVLITP